MVRILSKGIRCTPWKKWTSVSEFSKEKTNKDNCWFSWEKKIVKVKEICGVWLINLSLDNLLALQWILKRRSHMEFWLKFPVNLPRILEEFHCQLEIYVIKEFVGKRRWDWNRWRILIGIPNGFSFLKKRSDFQFQGTCINDVQNEISILRVKFFK